MLRRVQCIEGKNLPTKGTFMQPLPQNSALIIIDVQKGFDDPIWGRRNNLYAEENIARLLAAWRNSSRAVFHIQHLSRLPDSPLRPGYSGSELKPSAQPLLHETVIQKHVNSAFIGTNLEASLRQNALNSLVIVGLTTDHCVSTTARMAGNLGFDTYVVSDATATFDRIGPDGNYYKAEDIHAISLTSLHREFATVIDTETLIENIE
jgi:nicotinamidase-related amidase